MSESPRTSRIEGLDLLRGVAIGLVLVRHAWPEQIGGAGIVGVTVFFTLSGYLITGVIMKDVERFGRVRYAHFYRNRALRLLPALTLMLVVYAVVTLIAFPDERGLIPISLLVGFTYLADVPFFHISENLGHLWTLAVEEQFYLVWPALLLFGFRYKRVGLAVLVSGAAIYLASLASVVAFRSDIVRIYSLPTSWAIAMVIGAASWLWRHRVTALLTNEGRPRTTFSLAAAAGLVVISCLPDLKGLAITYVLLGPLIAALTVVLIAHLQDWKTVPADFLRYTLLPLGTVSYAAYLWNYLIASWLRGGDLNRTNEALLSIVLTLLAATASWWLVERPAQSLKFRLDARVAGTRVRAETELAFVTTTKTPTKDS